MGRQNLTAVSPLGTVPDTNVEAVTRLVERLRADGLDEMGEAMAMLALTFALALDTGDDAKLEPSLGRELRLTLLELAPRGDANDGDPDSWLRDAMPTAVQHPA